MEQSSHLKILVTGGAGFIGSALIRHILADTPHFVINVDTLTYAGINNQKHPRYLFEKEDICDAFAMQKLFDLHQPDLVMHLAAETHVDRSIDNPHAFIQTNIVGTFTLLEQAKIYWSQLPNQKKANFRFHHISTDEVFGDLADDTETLFTEKTPYDPSSPYSASKASADHLVRAWHRTYGLPTLISNTTNNYGPYQYPEKFIPRVILNALAGLPLPIYGDGRQSRDWLYVDDHAKALLLVALQGKVGEVYNIGGHNERQNIEVVHNICRILDEKIAQKPSGIQNFHELITFVTDRPGHDKRYAIDASKIQQTLGWYPKESFESGLYKTVEWYVKNKDWLVQQNQEMEVSL